jgi:hypothetical protein
MFRVERYDTYTTLQTPISIQDAIVIANVVGSVILTSIDLVANVASGGEENDLDSLDEYVGGSRDSKNDVWLIMACPNLHWGPDQNVDDNKM